MSHSKTQATSTRIRQAVKNSIREKGETLECGDLSPLWSRDENPTLYLGGEPKFKAATSRRTPKLFSAACEGLNKST
jgi:hypothetical protein